jgi:hypothetical protein
MRLIDKLLGKRQRNSEAAHATVSENNPRLALPRESVFSGSPTRILRTASDAKKDDALLDMSQVVAEIEKNPTANWQKYKGDFEKAVTGMKEAFDASPGPDHVRVDAVSKESLRQTLTDSGWKLSSRDERAISAYEESCKELSTSPNPYDAGTWLKEFRGLDEEQRQDQVDAQRLLDRETGIDR